MGKCESVDSMLVSTSTGLDVYRRQEEMQEECNSAGAMSFLFSSISERMSKRLDLEAAMLFGHNGIPANMITVHIRWGEKHKEMNLAPVRVYIDLVKRIATKCMLPAQLTVFLMYESPAALAEFKAN